MSAGHRNADHRLEDNIRFDRDRLASSNAEPVERIVAVVAAHGRSAATPTETRALLSLGAG